MSVSTNHNPNPDFWRDRRVFLTGHTGFKGSWLALWLEQLGAIVYGFALAPPTAPNLFTVARVADGLAEHRLGDIRDSAALAIALTQARPDIVLHLAAQPLVRYSYQDPIGTYATNVMGTAHLLEAVRATHCVQAVVSVTTDKCYQNNEWIWGYREDEPLGGHDPYSSSKGCAELVTAAYRASFLATVGVALASARAGNVIGGGDWATDRLVPDFFRAADASQPLAVRFPDATRPWQHVLEPLAGYLLLAERLVTDGASVAEAWNFGPADEDVRPVRWVLNRLAAYLPGATWCCPETQQPHEAGLLKLDSSKARARLGWTPRWRLDDALTQTVNWHTAWRAGCDMRLFCQEQLRAYQTAGAL